MARRRRRRKSREDAVIGIIALLAFLTFFILPQIPQKTWLILGGILAAFLIIGWMTGSLFASTPDPDQPATPSWSPELIKQLDWKRFEELCAWYFEESGYQATVSSFGADGGIDILVHSSTGDLSAVVQCKAWINKPVGVKEVRELFGVMHDRGCPNGVLIGLSGFSQDATAFAQNKSIDLISTSQLLNLIAMLPAETQARLLSKTTSGDYTTPSCPNCGIKLKLRTAKTTGKQFWGCPRYPQCKYLLNK